MDDMEIIEECPSETTIVVHKKRRKDRNPDRWTANLRKKLRSGGHEYIDSRGNLRAARMVRPKDCSKCKKKCNENFTDADRERIHKAFWGLNDYEKQRYFISTMVEEGPKATVTTKSEKSRRAVTRHYFLRKGSQRLPVCLGFFLSTLDVSEAVVKNIVKNRDETTSFPKRSGRGSKGNNSRPQEAREYIRQHIRSFFLPQTEVATPKKKRKRDEACEPEQVVAAGLNTTRMWNAYVRQCEWEGVVPEKLWLYRDVVNKEFNIKFLDPCSRRGLPKVEEVMTQEQEEIEEEEEEEQGPMKHDDVLHEEEHEVAQEVVIHEYY